MGVCGQRKERALSNHTSYGQRKTRVRVSMPSVSGKGESISNHVLQVRKGRVSETTVQMGRKKKSFRGDAACGPEKGRVSELAAEKMLYQSDRCAKQPVTRFHNDDHIILYGVHPKPRPSYVGGSKKCACQTSEMIDHVILKLLL